MTDVPIKDKYGARTEGDKMLEASIIMARAVGRFDKIVTMLQMTLQDFSNKYPALLSQDDGR